MAQSGFTPIQLYFTTTAAAAPSAGNLANGELAINITDGRLFYKDNGGTVRVLAGTGGSGVVAGSNTQVQFNNNGVFGASANMVFNGTRLTVADLADSGLTSGRVVYAGSGGALVDSAALTFDGNGNLTLGGSTPRLLSNMSGALSSRFIVQNSTTNGNTRVYFYPNGTGNISAINGVNNSNVDATDYQAFDLAVIGTTDVRLSSNATGAATPLPLTFYTHGSEQMRLTSTGLGIGTSSPTQRLTVLNSNGTYGTLYQPAVQIGNSSSGGTLTNPTGLGALVWSTDGTATPVASIEAVRENPTSGAASALYFRTGSSGGGTTKAILDSSGNLGLGVTPSAWGGQKAFQTEDASFSGRGNTADLMMNAYFDGSNYRYARTFFASRYQQQDGSHRWAIAPSGTAGNAISFTQAMTLDASGNLGIGVTDPGARLEIGSSGTVLAKISSSTNTAFRGVQFGLNADSNVYGSVAMEINGGEFRTSAGFSGWGGLQTFYTNGSERARIDSSGNLNIGTTSTYLNRTTSNGGYSSTNSMQFNIASVNSSTQFEWVMRSGTEMQFYVSNATVLARLTASGVWTNASDARYKENIRPVHYGLTELMQLQPRAYNVIGSEKQEIGFVAQEVELLIPELVESTKNSVTEEDRLTLSYGQLSAVIVKAIQELKAEFDAYKATHP